MLYKNLILLIFIVLTKEQLKKRKFLTALRELIYHDEKYLAGWHQVK
ncbi:hypothetical protein J505_2887 [Acinetobacter baumannii 1297549]|nr:hypothetical protein J505_2887 [Acinetobacter baumannii 1297549]